MIKDQDYLKRKKTFVYGTNARDYSLSNNNLAVEELSGLISAQDIGRICELVTSYPDFEYKDLRQAIYNYYKVRHIALGCGSEELIVRINSYLRDCQKRVGVFLPNFYRIIDTCPGYKPLSIKYSSKKINFSLRASKKDRVFDNLDAVWLSNPNPIIGKICERSQLKSLVENNPRILFIIDEGAMDLVRDSDKYSMLQFSQRVKNLLVIRSFSKLFGLAGMRIGFIAGNKRIIDLITKQGSTFPVNNLGDYLLRKILKDRRFVNGILYKIHKNKRILEYFLESEIKLRLSKSITNCVFVEPESVNFFKSLIAAGIVPLKLENQIGIDNQKTLRITVHSSEKIFNDLMDKLKKINK